MTAHEPVRAIYRFEAIDETLPFLPLAARRALDRLGLKLSLVGWRSLPLEARQGIVRAGAGGPEAVAEAAAFVRGATPAATPIEPVVEVDASSVPGDLGVALGPSRPLDDARWRALRPLDRYALVKLAPRPDKLALAYDEIAAPVPFTHLAATGEAHMVDVGAKSATARRAVATARVRTTPEVVAAIAAGGHAKGDVLAAARIAGLMAAKRTPELIPLCHPVQTTRAAIDFEPEAAFGALRVRATVEAFDRTGVEMEAMVAASVASLTVYDMIKSADRWASIEAVRLEEKSGGKSGALRRPEGHGAGPSPDARSGVIALVEGVPSLDEAVASVRDSGAGAVCAFLGMVRDNNEGRAVVKLEYQAYAAMAVAEMRRIAAEIAGEIPGVRLAAIHRTGSLGVGDVAVVCAASAPHRGEAYRACRALIDRVKARVPIWKREHGPDGAWWIGWQDARCEGDDHEPGEGHHHAGRTPAE